MLDSSGRQFLPVPSLEQALALDGRRARGNRTRQHIVEAYLQLLRSEGPGVALAEVADLAGCSRRSIFAHFSAVADLRCAAADHLLEQMEFSVAGEDTTGSALSRLRREVKRRERECQAWWPLWRAYQAAAPVAPELEERFDRFRRGREARANQVFDRELRGTTRAARRAFDVQLGTLTSIASWAMLRDSYQLTVPGIRQHWSTSLLRLLPRRGQRLVEAA
jgi:AcrR family transcriptional regulator